MAVCPRCKANIPDSAKSCPKCNMLISRGGPALSGSGGLLGDTVLVRQVPQKAGKLLTVGPTTYGDKMSFVGGSDAAQQIKNINVNDLNETQFASITNQLNTILTQMSIPIAIDKDTKLNLSRNDKTLVDLIAKKVSEADLRFGKPVGNPELYMRLGNVCFLTKRSREYAMTSGDTTMLIEVKDEYSYEQAIDFYDKAIKIKPDYEEAGIIKVML
jgi:hypothetical protein